MNQSVSLRPAEWVIGILAAIFFSTSVYYASSELAGRRAHREESVQHQLAIVRRQPMIIDGTPSDISEYRSRVLVPYTLVLMDRLHVFQANRQRYMAVRLQGIS